QRGNPMPPFLCLAPLFLFWRFGCRHVRVTRLAVPTCWCFCHCGPNEGVCIRSSSSFLCLSLYLFLSFSLSPSLSISSFLSLSLPSFLCLSPPSLSLSLSFFFLPILSRSGAH